jgi:hypothetical protein
MAGGAAAAAAAITLADPDGAARRSERNQDVEKKPIVVKESVPADVLDRLDEEGDAPRSDAAPADPNAKPAAPRDALDFGGPQ